MAIPLSARKLGARLAILILFVGTSTARSGDPSDATYRTGTTEVRIRFSASDPNDHALATLEARDIAVVDTGIIVRDFKSFTRSDTNQLEIAILIDASESVGTSFRSEIAGAFEFLSESNGIPENNLSLLSFHGRTPAFLCAGNCRSSHLAELLPATEAKGLTPLFDSIVFACDYLAGRGDAKTERVLVVFSDGQDTISRNSFRDALDAGVTKDIQIYAVGRGKVDGYDPGTQVLRVLTSATGGRFYSTSVGASRALDQILENFHTSYAVGYRLPTRTRGFHSVLILPTHNSSLRFRSRSGYYYPDSIR